jgi:hypothetical protein
MGKTGMNLEVSHVRASSGKDGSAPAIKIEEDLRSGVEDRVNAVQTGIRGSSDLQWSSAFLNICARVSKIVNP